MFGNGEKTHFLFFSSMIQWNQVETLLSDYFLDKNFVFHFYEDNNTIFHSFIVVLYIIKVRTQTDESSNMNEHATYHAVSGSIYIARILDLHDGQFVHKVSIFESFKSITINCPISYQKLLYDCFMRYHFDEELYVGEKVEYNQDGKLIQVTQYNGNGHKEQIYCDKNMILKQKFVNRRFSGEQICEFKNGDYISLDYDTGNYYFTSSYFSISCPNIHSGEFIIKTSQGTRIVNFTVTDKHWRFIHLQVIVK
jgi:hypothetical protein